MRVFRLRAGLVAGFKKSMDKSYIKTTNQNIAITIKKHVLIITKNKNKNLSNRINCKVSLKTFNHNVHLSLNGIACA